MSFSLSPTCSLRSLCISLSIFGLPQNSSSTSTNNHPFVFASGNKKVKDFIEHNFKTLFSMLVKEYAYGDIASFEAQIGANASDSSLKKVQLAFKYVGAKNSPTAAQRRDLVTYYGVQRDLMLQEDRLTLWRALPGGEAYVNQNNISKLSAKEIGPALADWINNNCNTITGLDLKNKNLKHLPPEIGKLSQLQRLDLGHNQLKTLPPEIKKLPLLKTLHIKNNHLKTLLHNPLNKKATRTALLVTTAAVTAFVSIALYYFMQANEQIDDIDD